MPKKKKPIVPGPMLMLQAQSLETLEKSLAAGIAAPGSALEAWLKQAIAEKRMRVEETDREEPEYTFTVYYNEAEPVGHIYRLTFSGPDNVCHSYFTFTGTAELFMFVNEWETDPPLYRTHITEIEAVE